MEKQTGKTKRAMQQAKRNSFYVWHDEKTDYPKSLAKYINRKDLKIVHSNWLSIGTINEYGIQRIVIDHNYKITPENKEIYKYYSEKEREWYKKEAHKLLLSAKKEVKIWKKAMRKKV